MCPVGLCHVQGDVPDPLPKAKPGPGGVSYGFNTRYGADAAGRPGATGPRSPAGSRSPAGGLSPAGGTSPHGSRRTSASGSGLPSRLMRASLETGSSREGGLLPMLSVVNELGGPSSGGGLPTTESMEVRADAAEALAAAAAAAAAKQQRSQRAADSATSLQGASTSRRTSQADRKEVTELGKILKPGVRPPGASASGASAKQAATSRIPATSAARAAAPAPTNRITKPLGSGAAAAKTVGRPLTQLRPVGGAAASASGASTSTWPAAEPSTEDYEQPGTEEVEEALEDEALQEQSDAVSQEMSGSRMPTQGSSENQFAMSPGVEDSAWLGSGGGGSGASSARHSRYAPPSGAAAGTGIVVGSTGADADDVPLVSNADYSRLKAELQVCIGCQQAVAFTLLVRAAFWHWCMCHIAVLTLPLPCMRRLARQRAKSYHRRPLRRWSSCCSWRARRRTAAR